MSTRRRAVKPPTITSVSFRSSVPGPDRFQHLHVEATASVPPGEDAEAVLDGVKDFVARQLVRAKRGEVAAPVPVEGRFQDRLKAHERS